MGVAPPRKRPRASRKPRTAQWLARHFACRFYSSQWKEVLPDGQRRQVDCRDSRLRGPLGLRASLPHVQGVADASHPPDGRGSRRLPARRLTLPCIDGLRPHVEFHRRGRFDATITLHDGRSFGVVRQGLALRRRSLYDRLRAIAEYDYTRRPDTILIVTPSTWEERLTTRFCEERNLRECFVAVESRGALERRDLRLWCCTSWVIGSRFFRTDVSVTCQPSLGAAAIDQVRREATTKSYGVLPACRTLLRATSAGMTYR